MHIKVEESDKAAIQAAAAAAGMSAGAFMINAARQVLREGELRVLIDWTPTPALQEMIDSSDEDDAEFVSGSEANAAYLKALL